MKQIIPFVKDLSFNTRLSEVTSIALEHNLALENNDSIVGNFIVSGKYKINDISVNEESFEQNIPFDITLDDKYDATKLQLDIDDFYYEIINDEFLRVHIDVLADNLVYYKEKEPIINELEENISVIEEEIKDISDNDERDIKKENDNSSRREEIKNMINEETNKDDLGKNEQMLDMQKEKTIINKKEIGEIASALQSGFLSDKESYSTYKIHIIRENETIETIKEMYNISNEELEKYNVLDKIVLGTKLIIPVLDE